MTTHNIIPETAVDPVCGKTFNPRDTHFSASDSHGTHYFCSAECRRKYDGADAKTRKGFWARYTDRLKDTHCTQTPPECH